VITTTPTRELLCATDEVAARIEELQLVLGVGPGVDAAASGAPVLIPDLHDPWGLAVHRWEPFLTGAVAAGVAAVFAFPLRIGAAGLGTLTLHRDRPGELGPSRLAAALLAADAVSVALLYLPHGPDGDHGVDVSTGRTVQVHQATGMVQVQLGVPTEDAFLALRARAFATGRSMVDVASDVVARRLRFSMEDE
jgi:hypothetical protein